MCRMFAIISSKEENVSPWFFEAKIPFKDFSERDLSDGPHNSGWGICWIEEDGWKIFKEGKKQSFSFDKIHEVNSDLIFIHLRKASVGAETVENAHPFSYGKWVFEHNGKIDFERASNHLNEKFREKVQGQTDSEVLFLLIMQFLEEDGDVEKAIKKALGIVKMYPHTGLNFLLSDGKSLYVFRDVSPEHFDRQSYFCLHYLVKDGKVIFSSDALDDDSWNSLGLCELLSVDKNLKINKKKLQF